MIFFNYMEHMKQKAPTLPAMTDNTETQAYGDEEEAEILSPVFTSKNNSRTPVSAEVCLLYLFFCYTQIYFLHLRVYIFHFHLINGNKIKTSLILKKVFYKFK